MHTHHLLAAETRRNDVVTNADVEPEPSGVTLNNASDYRAIFSVVLDLTLILTLVCQSVNPPDIGPVR